MPFNMGASSSAGAAASWHMRTAMLRGMDSGDVTRDAKPGRSRAPGGGEILEEFVERVSVTLNDAGHAASWVSKETVDRLWLESDGELVSQLCVVDVTVRAWGDELRCAGVADVGTPEPHRMKGYASRLMAACERFAARRGYAVCTLFGIPDFYHRFGYATICPEYDIRIDLDALETDEPAASLEDVRSSDWDAIARMCNMAYAGLDGSVVRREGAWRGPRQGSDWSQRPRALVSRDARGQPAGYAVVDTELTDDCLTLSEAAARDDAAARALSAGLAGMARSLGATGLLARVHPDAGLGPLLTRLGGALVVTRPTTPGTWRALSTWTPCCGSARRYSSVGQPRATCQSPRRFRLGPISAMAASRLAARHRPPSCRLIGSGSSSSYSATGRLENFRALDRPARWASRPKSWRSCSHATTATASGPTAIDPGGSLAVEST